MPASESSRTANDDHCNTNEGVNFGRQVNLDPAAASGDQHRRNRSNSNSSGVRSPTSPPTHPRAGTVVNHTPKSPKGRCPGGGASNPTLPNVDSEGCWASGLQNVVFQGPPHSSSLQKHLVFLDDSHMPRGTPQNCDPRPFCRMRREVWDSGNPQRCAAMLQRRSTSSVSLATPRRQLSAALYARHQQPVSPERVRRLIPDNEVDEENSRATCPQGPGGPERPTYGRAVTTVPSTTQSGGAGMVPREGFARRGTTTGGRHQKRGKTAREAKLASQRHRRGRKYRTHSSPAVSSRLRRMLRLRTSSATDNCPGKVQYYRVYMVLGLVHHRNGGDFVQNGFVCLRACDVTHETNALISEAATFIWDRDRVSPELTMPPVCRTGTGTGVTPPGEPWMGGGMLVDKDLDTTTAGSLGLDTSATSPSSGGGQKSKGGPGAARNSAFSLLTFCDGSFTQKCGCSRPSSQTTVFTIGVRVAVKPSTPSEELKCITYLRDYLASQLTTYPFLRHYVLITKFKKKYSSGRFLSRWRQPPPFSVIGTGQYSAVVNASTQVDGLTPLEVCIMHRQKRCSFDNPRITASTFNFLTTVAGTLRSFMWKDRLRSR